MQMNTLYILDVYDLNIFYFISHEKGLGRAQMLCYSPLPKYISFIGFWKWRGLNIAFHYEIYAHRIYLQSCVVFISLTDEDKLQLLVDFVHNTAKLRMTVL